MHITALEPENPEGDCSEDEDDYSNIWLTFDILNNETQHDITIYKPDMGLSRCDLFLRKEIKTLKNKRPLLKWDRIAWSTSTETGLFKTPKFGMVNR
jgi:hypothetical protein